MLKGLLSILLVLLSIVLCRAQIDSLKIQNPAPQAAKAESAYDISDSGLQTRLKFGAADTQFLDKKNQAIHLYGNAFVRYEEKELMADYIYLQLDKNIAEARKNPSLPNSIPAIFKDSGKEFQYNSLRYNFETEKGVVIDAVTKEGEFVIHGQRTKYVNETVDTVQNTTIYNANSLITTCQHDEPHFGIRAKKMKLINDKLAVFGPSNLEIAGVPTPLIIPFGFYPLTQGKSSGFIFPQNYQFNSRALGFGLLGFGWYFPVNDYVHVRLTADLYTRGTYALYANTTYKKKYKYQGSLRLAFNDRRTDGIERFLDENGQPKQRAAVISEKGYSIVIDHKQDPKAHPFVDVGGRINVIGNNNQLRNFNDVGSVLTNTYNSNFYYRHSLPGSVFSFNMGLTHNQNTRTRIVNITLPDIQLNMNTIYPFEQKNRGGNKEKWYERISFDYDMKMRSFVQTTDSTLFTSEMYDDIKTGMNHSIITGLSTRVFKFFNLVPRATYDETWVLNSIDKDIRVSEFSKEDTLVTDVLTGFDGFRTYNAGISINTQMFGTAEFKKGWLRGIRHTIKPEIGYSYAPDTRSTYRDTVFYTDAERAPEIYTRFDDGPFNNANFTELQSQLQYRLQNVVELKYWSKKDSMIKKARIFDNLTMSGNFNYAKDSLKWSAVNINSTSRYFNGITTVISSWRLDPYMEEDNRPVDKLVWNENKRLVRLESGQVRVTNRFNFRQIIDLFKKSSDSSSEENNTAQNDVPDSQNMLPDGFAPPSEQRPGPSDDDRSEKGFADIFENIRLEHNILYTFTAEDGKVESEMRTHALGISGRIPLTNNWSINVGNLSYDFVNKGIGYTTITFSRKLHCWDMNFSWAPQRDTYTFSIGVSSNTLSFLKYNFGQNNVDGVLGRF